mmetsp:Transcript_18077/g.51883  ORF Transcript_18077/g.51883 Transcript_18077/m.51883 type:complete len:288 (+) Transcript_18077:427-1290(+)
MARSLATCALRTFSRCLACSRSASRCWTSRCRSSMAWRASSSRCILSSFWWLRSFCSSIMRLVCSSNSCFLRSRSASFSRASRRRRRSSLSFFFLSRSASAKAARSASRRRFSSSSSRRFFMSSISRFFAIAACLLASCSLWNCSKRARSIASRCSLACSCRCTSSSYSIMLLISSSCLSLSFSRRRRSLSSCASMSRSTSAESPRLVGEAAPGDLEREGLTSERGEAPRTGLRPRSGDLAPGLASPALPSTGSMASWLALLMLARYSMILPRSPRTSWRRSRRRCS